MSLCGGGGGDCGGGGIAGYRGSIVFPTSFVLSFVDGFGILPILDLHTNQLIMVSYSRLCESSRKPNDHLL